MLCFVFDVLVMNDIKPLIISNIEAKPNSCVRLWTFILISFSSSSGNLLDTDKILIGFSKGVVVLNQIIHEISSLYGSF